jgi:hypothetical protein
MGAGDFEQVHSTEELDPSQSAKGLEFDPSNAPQEPDPDFDNDPAHFDSQLDKVRALARGQFGKKEQPCGTGKNPYSSYFGFEGQPWCADFIAFCFDQTEDKDHKVPWGFPSAVRNVVNWARANDLIAEDAFGASIFAYPNNAHMGLITGAERTRFETIEGNTIGADGTTCWVTALVRNTGDDYVFIRWPS